MVVDAADEVVGGRCDLDEVGDVPRSSKRHGRLVEQQVDVGRDERLAVSAHILLRDEPDDGCIFLGEGLLVGEIRLGGRRPDERRQRDGDDEEVPWPDGPWRAFSGHLRTRVAYDEAL